jgi:hypothetical protein
MLRATRAMRRRTHSLFVISRSGLRRASVFDAPCGALRFISFSESP